MKTAQLYTEKFLIKKGISYCKMIAKSLGIVPQGDLRQTYTWAAAIVAAQGTPVEVPAKQVRISYDDSIDGVVNGDYCVTDSGDIIHRTRTYQQAVRFCQVHGYDILDEQEIAQQELEQELERQIEERIVPVYFLEKVPEHKYEVLELEFGVYEVRRDGELIAEIQRDFTRWGWYVGLQYFEAYAEAEAFAINEDKNNNGKSGGRGSGRVHPEYILEPCHYQDCDEELEPHNVYKCCDGSKTFLGVIYADHPLGWKVNPKKPCHFSWQDCVSQLL